MILKIGVDTSQNKATVEGQVNHSQKAKGGSTLQWKCEPGGGHESWRVKFTNGSPFRNGDTEFGRNDCGADGDVLKKPSGTEPERYKYDVRCVSGGTTYDTDPEIVLWPE